MDDPLLEAIWEWDPIGVNEFRAEIPREYDELRRVVARWVTRSLPILRLRELLIKELRETYDLGDYGVDAFLARVQEIYRTNE